MIKKTKNINLLILWLAGLLIIAHSVIPHDHHFDFNHEKHHHNESSSQNEPFHCFSFNDIISQNTDQGAYKNNNSKVIVSFDLNENYIPFQLLETYLLISFSENDRLKNQIVFFKNIPVRGSPLFA